MWMWQAPNHLSKSIIQLQDSMHQAHAHHPWNIHVAQPKSWILRATQDPGGFWRVKPFANSVAGGIWLTTKFYESSVCHQNVKVSCPWARPWCTLNFLPGIAQKLILAPSEATRSHLGLDKGKTQTIDTRSSTNQTCKNVQSKQPTQDWTNLAPTAIEKYSFTIRV